MNTPTLTESLDAYAADNACPGSIADAAIRRAYMAGALAAITSKAPREQLLAECVGFGRALGSKAEAATNTRTA